MQKIYLEKFIDRNHQMSELVSIHCDEAIDYKLEEAGMRAKGQIIITGDYLKTASKERFNETLEVDILAPFEKIIDQHEFSIKIEDFDYKLINGNLLVTIEAVVYGVENGEDKHYNDRYLREEVVDQDLVEEIKEVLEKPATPSVQEEVKEEKKIKEEKVSDQIDDLIEVSDQEDLVPYYVHVVEANQDYTVLENMYHVPASVIKNYNHDLVLQAGALVIIPYYLP